MFKWLLPHEANFYDYFEKHSSLVVKGAEELFSLLSTVENISQKAHTIQDLEHAADVVTHQCIEELHKTFITPFERNDIHHLISNMDDIIDYIEEIANRIVIYKLHEINSFAVELAGILVKATHEIDLIVLDLRNLKSTDSIRKLFDNVSLHEKNADKVYRKALANLFETNQDATTIIKWKEIYEHLENSIDSCKDAADIIEGVILESS